MKSEPLQKAWVQVGEQVKPTEKGSPCLIRSLWAWLARNGTQISLPGSPQSNASHLLLTLFPLAHSQIAWIKHQSRKGGAVLSVFHYCLCHIPSLLPFPLVPSPSISLINNLYLIGLSWSSQIGLLGSCTDGEENDSDRPSICFWVLFSWMDGGKRRTGNLQS